MLRFVFALLVAITLVACSDIDPTDATVDTGVDIGPEITQDIPADLPMDAGLAD